MLDDIQCVIILGGKSSRFVDESNDPKPNYLIHNKTWLSWQLNFVSQLGIRDVILVLGYHFESLLDKHPFLVLDKFVDHGSIRVLATLNDDPTRGPFSSLQLGFRQTTAKKVIYFPIDVPSIDKKAFAQLMSVSGPYQVTKCCYKNKGGHPLLIQGLFLEKLKNDFDSTHQLNQLIRRVNSDFVCRLSVDTSDVLLNLNEPFELDEYVQNNPKRFKSLDKSFTQN